MSNIGRVYGGNHIGKLRGPDHATRTAAIMAQSPNMDRRDAQRLSHRQWAENPDMRQGNVSTSDLWGKYSYKNAGVKANAQAQAEGSLAGQYGGGDFGTVFGQNHNRTMSDLSIDMLRSDLDNAKYTASNRDADRANAISEFGLKMAGLEMDNKTKTLQFNTAQRQADWASQDRQAGFDAKAQAQADAQAKAQREAQGFDKYVAYMRRFNPEFAEIFDTPEALAYAKASNIVPNPMLGQTVNGNPDMVYTSPNSVSFKPQPKEESPYNVAPGSFFDNEGNYYEKPAQDINGNWNFLGGNNQSEAQRHWESGVAKVNNWNRPDPNEAYLDGFIKKFGSSAQKKNNRTKYIYGE